MDIKEYLDCSNFKTRKQLIKETGMTDRCIRRLISQLKVINTVLYNSQQSGYRLAKPLENLSREELIEELKLVNHCINDIEARKEKFNQQERQYIAYLEKGKEFLLKRTEEELYGKVKY